MITEQSLRLIEENYINEDLLEESRMKAAIISMAMAVTSALVGAGVINGNKQRNYNTAMTNELTKQASADDIAKGKADFMFDGYRIQYDTNSNTLKINGKKMKEKKAVKQTSLNGSSLDAMRDKINTQKASPILKELQFECTKLGATVSYDSKSDTYTIIMNKDRRDVGSVSNAKNTLVKKGFKIKKQGGNSFKIQKTKGWF